MRYISKLTGIGIGCCTVPGRKEKSLVYIQGNRETVIGTVRNEELFERAIEEILYHQFDDQTERAKRNKEDES